MKIFGRIMYELRTLIHTYSCYLLCHSIVNIRFHRKYYLDLFYRNKNTTAE